VGATRLGEPSRTDTFAPKTQRSLMIFGALCAPKIIKLRNPHYFVLV
jgi:hypothetical protein